MNGIPADTPLQKVSSIELCLENIPTLEPFVNMLQLRNLIISNCNLTTIPKTFS